MDLDKGTGATSCYWERGSRPPILFPVASVSGRRYTGGESRGPGGPFGTNVDSLHILRGGPPGPPRKMFRSVARSSRFGYRDKTRDR